LGNASYQLVLQGVRSADGHLFDSQVFSFTTGSPDPGPAPQVVAVTPLPGQVQLPPTTRVTISFSKRMNQASVEQAFSISGGVTGGFSWSTDGRVMTFTPGQSLASNTTYYVTLLNACYDYEGNQLTSGVSWNFRTRVIGIFAVVKTVPAEGSTTATADTKLRFTFNEAVDRTTVVTNFAIDPPRIISNAQFSYEQQDQVIVYTADSYFSAGETVTATWSTGLMSITSDTLSTAFTLQFTIEDIAPEVLSTDPLNGATQVPADQVVRFFFSEPLDPATVSAATFTVVQGGPIPGSLSLDDNDRTVVFTPATAYTTSAVPVTVTALGGIADLGGTPLGSDVIISFSIDDVPPGFLSSIPADGATGVICENPQTIDITFTEAMNQVATEAGVSFSPATGGGGIFSWASASRLVYTTTTPFVGSTDYVVSVTMEDLAGNVTTDSVGFRTDDTAPQVNLVVPNPGATGVAVDSTISITFSEPMQRQSLEDSFFYSDGVDTFDSSDGTINFDDPTYPTQLDFIPTTPLALSTVYTVSVSSGARDVGGNQLLASYNSTFTTTDS
jgi:hypothetical protein